MPKCKLELVLQMIMLPHFGMTQFCSDQSTETVALCPYHVNYVEILFLYLASHATVW